MVRLSYCPQDLSSNHISYYPVPWISPLDFIFLSVKWACCYLLCRIQSEIIGEESSWCLTQSRCFNKQAVCPLRRGFSLNGVTSLA